MQKTIIYAMLSCGLFLGACNTDQRRTTDKRTTTTTTETRSGDNNNMPAGTIYDPNAIDQGTQPQQIPGQRNP